MVPPVARQAKPDTGAITRSMADEEATPPSFCVVGAGIIGLSTAYSLAKRFHGCHLAIIYDKCSPDTTSNHGFGICSIPGLTDDLDNPQAIPWTKATTSYCDKIIEKQPLLAEEMGIMAVSTYLVFDKMSLGKDSNSPKWDTFSFSQKLSSSEIVSLGMRIDGMNHVFDRKFVPEEHLEVVRAGTWVIDTSLYLPWMKKELDSMAIKGEIARLDFVKKRISDFSELSTGNYDFIVNCTGLGSEFLVPDEKMIPIRGQYIVVDGTGVEDLRYANHTFVCPKSNRVALGTVYQRGRRDTEPSSRDREDILRRCQALNPKLLQCRALGDGVGIRPGRYGGARVEMEWRRLGSGASLTPIIHNYGHGTRGIMQHWGCAQEVVKLVERCKREKSKL